MMKIGLVRRAVAAAIVVASLGVAVPGSSGAGADNGGKAVAGARSLGDPLLPQLGNGGYDVRHYRIELAYDPELNHFDAAQTTIRAVADTRLSELSFDFQDVLEVVGVTVNGRPAEFRSAAATPQLSDDPEITQPMKLVVTPHPSAQPKPGRRFTVVVQYRGTPEEITDPDESIEGWIRACFPLAAPQTCDGAFVVNEPMGAQSWFPSNNYPTDKATFDTLITVPEEKTALGIGELVSQTDNGDGTTTWHWHEDDPSATYLTTATVGDFIYREESMVETSTGRTLPVYNAIDATATATQLDAIDTTLGRAASQINFLSELFGRYPFDSTGAVADRAAGVGYALEVQTKPHYSGGFVSGNPSINVGTQLHELAHQWVGNSVTLAQWSDIWFNEGWANWSEWYWDFLEDGGDDPVAIFDDLYASTPAEDWEIAPAVLDGDPANLFVSFPTYDRGAMTVQGYREIVGDESFLAFAKAIQRRFRHGNISTTEFIDFAVRRSRFRGDERALLEDFFQEWLYGETKPTILPEDFE
jgi:aminopeptidase N